MRCHVLLHHHAPVLQPSRMNRMMPMMVRQHGTYAPFSVPSEFFVRGPAMTSYNACTMCHVAPTRDGDVIGGGQQRYALSVLGT